jgi:hypothetical protein
VRSLREIELAPDSVVAELPDGSGYPTVFLRSLRPEWDAARGARLFVQSVEAEQLAGWAMLLLTRQLAPPAGSIRVVRAHGSTRAPLPALERSEGNLPKGSPRTQWAQGAPATQGAQGAQGTLSDEAFDVALVYNPAPWLGPPERWPALVRAGQFVVV